jgi:hypothetical protein
MNCHLLNFFEISNVATLPVGYRLVDIEGLTREGEDGDLVDRKLTLLRTQVLFQERFPVALVRSAQKPVLAIPAGRELTKFEYQLVPEVVTLRPRPEVAEGAAFGGTWTDRQFRDEVVRFTLAAPLMGRNDLWSSRNTAFFPKRPVNADDTRRDIDVYEGFSYRVIELDGGLYLSVRLVHRYVESAWLVDRYSADQLRGLKMRHVLYHFGHRWYPIQLIDCVPRSVKDCKFVVNGETHNVFDWTKAKGGANPPDWVAELDPYSAAIRYRYPGSNRESFGAVALGKLMLRTSDPGVDDLHELSIRSPAERLQLTSKIVDRHFSLVRTAGIGLRINPEPLARQAKRFLVPAQRFGQDTVLRVGRNPGVGVITLDRLGHERMQRLLDPRGGLAVTGLIGPQYLIVPKMLDRPIVEDFGDRLAKMVRQFTKNQFPMERIVYDDDHKTTLKAQVDAIVESVSSSAAKVGGHALLVLPARAKADLHNYIKRRLHPMLQMQCVMAGTLRRFYEHVPNGQGGARTTVARHLERRYTSMLRYTALGLLITNRQWPWVLDDPTHYDTYVGLDVLNGTAAFAFFRDGGRTCLVRTERSKQKEKLLRSQVRLVVCETVREYLGAQATPIRSLVLRRDGRVFESEWAGFTDAARDLGHRGLLAPDVVIGAVEVQKTSAIGVRLFARSDRGVTNPIVGSWCELGEYDGIVCTTGEPFGIRGTVDPLHVRIARGDLALPWILEDTFAMSQLCWPVPDRCMRLPIDLKLCDDFLSSVASDAREDLAVYGDDNIATVEEPDLGNLAAVYRGAL